jgi:hypothetical protein
MRKNIIINKGINTGWKSGHILDRWATSESQKSENPVSYNVWKHMKDGQWYKFSCYLKKVKKEGLAAGIVLESLGSVQKKELRKCQRYYEKL